MSQIPEFERPIYEIEKKITQLKKGVSAEEFETNHEIKALKQQVSTLIKKTYSELSPWERVLLSRHIERPHFLDYLKLIFKNFVEIHGDRRFADDPSIVSGFAYLENKKVCVVGIEKGRNTNERIYRNFGMPNPEGYRKSIRVMKMASRFKIPIITFIDTPGAFPGIEAEERGQAEAIATNLTEIFGLNVPIISVIIGEGGSGGALALGVGDRVFMQEYSIYSVISPESCAAILWNDRAQSKRAANALRLDPHTAKKFNVIDGIIDEPTGGAHRDFNLASRLIKMKLTSELDSLVSKDIKKVTEERYQKYRRMGNLAIEYNFQSEAEKVNICPNR